MILFGTILIVRRGVNTCFRLLSVVTIGPNVRKHLDATLQNIYGICSNIALLYRFHILVNSDNFSFIVCRKMFFFNQEISH